MITIGYDPAGNVTLTLDPRGQGSTNTYDAANRRTLEVFTDGTRNTYTYDNVNNRLTAASPAGIYTSTYDPRNLVQSLQEPGGKFVTYTYDAAQRRISMSAYGKGLFTYTWDAAGRQTKVTSPTLKTTSMSYDGLNRLVRRQYANNAVTTQIFDPAGNLQVIGNVLSTGATVSRFTYTYDKANHRKTQLEADGTRTSWSYDRAYQLLNEKAAGGPTNTSFNVTHSYDPAGNRTLTKDGTTVTTYTYSVANRLTLAVANGVRTTYSYDLAGNRTKQQSSTFSTIFNWDASGRMISADLVAGIATFTYNADGQRVAKESTNAAVTGFLYDHKKLLHETDAADNILKTYTTTTDEEYGDLISETGESYHQYDAQANTNALIDDAGAIDARYKYFAYGEVSAVNLSGGSTWTKENWSSLPLSLSSDMMAGGKKQYYLDLETGLYLLGTGTNGRYYDPATARFMSEDPVRHASGDPNLFTYVQNDPINRLDPSGHEDQNDKDRKAKQQQAAQQTTPSEQKPAPAAAAGAGAGASKPSDDPVRASGQAGQCNTMICHPDYTRQGGGDFSNLGDVFKQRGDDVLSKVRAMGGTQAQQPSHQTGPDAAMRAREAEEYIKSSGYDPKMRYYHPSATERRITTAAEVTAIAALTVATGGVAGVALEAAGVGATGVTIGAGFAGGAAGGLVTDVRHQEQTTGKVDPVQATEATAKGGVVGALAAGLIGKLGTAFNAVRQFFSSGGGAAPGLVPATEIGANQAGGAAALTGGPPAASLDAAGAGAFAGQMEVFSESQGQKPVLPRGAEDQARSSASQEVPDSVVERQTTQDETTASARQRVADAIEAGGKRAKGAELQKLGKEVHDLSDATVEDAARDAGARRRPNPEINDAGGKGSVADNEVAKAGKSLVHEKKYQLPEGGEQLERAQKQLENIANRADKGVLEVAKPPTVKELAKFIDKLPPPVRQAIAEGRIQIVKSLTELYHAVRDFFR